MDHWHGPDVLNTCRAPISNALRRERRQRANWAQLLQHVKETARAWNVHSHALSGSASIGDGVSPASGFGAMAGAKEGGAPAANAGRRAISR